MVNLYQKTWAEINMELAKRIVQLRKRKKISQKEFAVRSGVSLGSLKRFEQTGEISLQSFTKLAIALDRKSTRLNSSHPLSSRMPSSA